MSHHPSQAPLGAPPPLRNGFGTAGFVLGLVGLVFSFIPIVGVVAWPLVILGIIFAVLGIVRVRARTATNMGLAVAGLVLSVLGLGISLAWTVAVVTTVDEANTDVNVRTNVQTPAAESVTQPGHEKDEWVLSVTTTGPGLSSVSYLKPDFQIAQDTSVKGKTWSVTLDGAAGRFAPNVNAQNKGGGTISCTISHNGKQIAENSSSGSYAFVMCTP